MMTAVKIVAMTAAVSGGARRRQVRLFAFLSKILLAGSEAHLTGRPVWRHHWPTPGGYQPC